MVAKSGTEEKDPAECFVDHEDARELQDPCGQRGNGRGEVAGRTTPYLLSDLPPDDEEKKAYLILYAVIVGCIKNRPLRLIMDTPSRDGREPLLKTATLMEEAPPQMQDHLA